MAIAIPTKNRLSASEPSSNQRDDGRSIVGNAWAMLMAALPPGGGVRKGGGRCGGGWPGPTRQVGRTEERAGRCQTGGGGPRSGGGLPCGARQERNPN